jgi:DNA repair exonuclease SbcCD ATPase subunit
MNHHLNASDSFSSNQEPTDAPTPDSELSLSSSDLALPDSEPLDLAQGAAEDVAQATSKEEQLQSVKGSKSSGVEKQSSNHPSSVNYASFMEAFSQQESVEQKLTLALDFMEQAIGQSETPHFKVFWEVRRQCLALFKENINSSLRAHLWAKYCDLSREARRLKEILDEQTAFAMEQIEIAVKALEIELSPEENSSVKNPTMLFAETPRSLTEEKISTYTEIQQRLGFLNAQAARIDVLREELIKTEMRVRHKNKFFERLSAAGDQVFPMRKELIKRNSLQFITDVDLFVDTYFPQHQPQGDLYALREEIKAWQGLAKQLTLNSHAFTHSRRRLSECWDKLKELEKERKKMRSQQRHEYKNNADAIIVQLNEFQAAIEAEQTSLEELRQQHSKLNDAIRKTELERDDVRSLRSSLDTLRQSIEAKEKAEQQIRDDEERVKQQQRQEKLRLFKEQITALTAEVRSLEMELLQQRYQELLAQCESAGFSRQERLQLERPFKELRENIAAQKDRLLLALADGGDDLTTDKAVLQADLRKLQTHRQQIKEQLEQLKRQAGTSGLDFTRAIELNEQIEAAKERLEKTDHAVRELSSKLRRYS